MKTNRMKLLISLLAAVLLLSCGMTVFAVGGNVFDPTVSVVRDTDTITVTVQQSNDAVLAEKQPSLVVACGFEDAYVTFGEEIVESVLDTEKQLIRFTVAKGGEYVIREKHTHTEGEAVKEKETPATCTTAGSYDSVVYCSDCGEELSRETKTVPVIDHADETGDGKCDVCGGDMVKKLWGDADGD